MSIEKRRWAWEERLFTHLCGLLEETLHAAGMELARRGTQLILSREPDSVEEQPGTIVLRKPPSDPEIVRFSEYEPLLQEMVLNSEGTSFFLQKYCEYNRTKIETIDALSTVHEAILAVFDEKKEMPDIDRVCGMIGNSPEDIRFRRELRHFLNRARFRKSDRYPGWLEERRLNGIRTQKISHRRKKLGQKLVKILCRKLKPGPDE
jgi:hypothetical protein